MTFRPNPSRRWLDAIRTRLWVLGLSRPQSRYYYTNGGIGDELMLTAIARAARRAGRPISVIATYPELWIGNGDPVMVASNLERWHYSVRRGWISTDIVHLEYQTSRPEHIAAQMAAHIPVCLPQDWRPILAVEPVSREAGLIVMQNSCRGARYAASTKEWPSERWDQLARRLSPKHRICQVGSPVDPPLPGAEDLRGRTTLRDVAGLLARAVLFVGLESGLQHVAAAVGTPAVIIYGGRSRPAQTGYAFNRNLVREPPCAGCGLNEGCPHAVMCMDIPVEEVERAVNETMAGPGP